MRRNKWRYLLLSAWVFLFALSGCALPGVASRDDNEELTAPATSTVEKAVSSKAEEPGEDPQYGRYDSVRIDACAGIRLFVNSRGKVPTVVAIQALNEKGEEALSEMDAAGVPYEDAVAEFAERIVNTGIVNAFHTNVTIGVENSGSNEAAELLRKRATEIFTERYAAHGLEALFEEENVSVGE